jgi:hypothetical protein
MQRLIETYPPEVEPYREVLLKRRATIEDEGRRQLNRRFRQFPIITAFERDAILRRTVERARPGHYEHCE